MKARKLRVIVLTHGNVSLLLEHLSMLESVEVVAVFVESKTQPERSFSEKLKRSVKYDGYFETFKKFGAKFLGGKTDGAAELELVQKNQKELVDFAKSKGISIVKVENYHSEESKKLLRDSNARSRNSLRNKHHQRISVFDSETRFDKYSSRACATLSRRSFGLLGAFQW